MTPKKHRQHIGSRFTVFLDDEGIREEIEAAAIKRILAYQVAQSIRDEGLTKAAMARRMHTSRAALNRLLDPKNGSVTLHTLSRAAAAVGKKIHLELIDLPSPL